MREHALHVYRDDARLATTVATFISPAFRGGQGILTAATPAHIAAIEQRLRTDGHDVDAARLAGRYVAMDVETIIPRLLRDGLPTAASFDELIGSPLSRLARDHGCVRAFGEIVSVLWRDGKRAAALRLEELWSASVEPVALLCGYRERVFGGQLPEAVRRAHGLVIGARGPEIARGRGLPETAAD